MLVPQPTSPSPQAAVLVLCPEAETAHYRTPLLQTCRVAATASAESFIQFLSRVKPSLLIVDGDRQDLGVPVCDAAKAVLPAAPSILVTLSQPEAAGQVIDKCDSILLKPFAPSLLAGRVGRLIRLQRSEHALERSGQLLEKIADFRVKSDHLLQRRAAGTLIQWPNNHCPYCDHASVTMFDYAANRRAWYACPQCRKVWVAKRLE